MANSDQISILLQDKGFEELNPVQAGYQRCGSGHSFGPSIREHYLIHYVVSGEGYFENKNNKYKVSAGSIFIIRPDEMTFYRASDSNPWEYIWIGFTGRLTSRLDELPDVVEIPDPTVFTDILSSSGFSEMREEYLAGQLFILLSGLFRSGERAPGYTSRTANYIDMNYMMPLSVERLAGDLCIDRRYLSRIFKRDYGISVKDYITKVRMTHAKKFLSEGHSVGRTAAMTGYGDVFNFSRMFKKYFGISPQTVRTGEKKKL